MNLLIRIVWFILIGWWLSIVWFILCLLLCIALIFLPIGAYAMTKTWKVMTLAETPKAIIINIENKISNK